jgi:ABC-type Fe3+/spermidine/putrescine transport system ATPase subunit
MADTHIRIVRVSKSFGSVEALKEVSLDIPRGSFTTFLGPSGCGKTTMLRTIAGFYELKQGEIYIGERRINDVPSHKRNAIMVFQDYALFPHMSIGENIAYGLKINKIPEEELRRRIERTTRYLGIQGLERRSPGEISGGQQQRVALARALVMEPEVLLLDEPLSNLDAKLRMNIRAELRQLQKRLGITTIYVTHDQAEALALSDQIAVMDHGRIIQAGTPREIYYRPRTVFVAAFVGTANLLEAEVEEGDGERTRVHIGDAVLQVAGVAPAVRTGERVTLCVRPETMTMAPAPPRGGGGRNNALRGTVVNHIFEGALVRYWVAVGDRQLIVDVFDPSDKGVLEGEVLLQLNPEKIHILPPEGP